ncbi:MAG TPA: hypothetical protein VES20_10075 [Bryobacteraceae bacterium]|nr:hypothetical protein [Bryobacteraceae bacterium]
MNKTPVVILGCGYTGQRVLDHLRADDVPVIATSRTRRHDRVSFEVSDPSVDLSFIPFEARVLYSIPNVLPHITAALAERQPSRLIYVSTTGVYGAQKHVDAASSAAPDRPEMVARVVAEQSILNGRWSGAVLRPAAIYGPDRGIHRRVQEGTFRLGPGEQGNYISRIHVHDLSRIVVRMLESDIEGAWPVADDHPCPSLEIAQFTAEILGISAAFPADPEPLHATRRSDRRVRGDELRTVLGLELRYPSYHPAIREALGVDFSTP